MNTISEYKPESLVKLKAGLVTLEGNLSLPKEVKGVVLFAHR
jgi:hypothetical protein